MAEGWARHCKSDCIEPYSAGIEKHGLNPRAVQVMQEAGVDISGHTSKTLEEIGPIALDWALDGRIRDAKTLCGLMRAHLFRCQRVEAG